ncbi:hypothetical protein DI09_15p270 [Mitosporidium daphniae]|uniref:sn-1-specific diacylglycerol lipase n=1 Tax=Mitosporidium daphniae TaxID=1485682 RepID=A0A098VUC6_9MICR|nr:uncharacterized protein DI09_15p270 [Mitosporidium daphniae]KGG52560.1 hypothetical protein DI09_15p270 [Mitosporidium daphniae]|eukprot:XP_013238987.1 uncharacterized protein DI09_15p270 [Mitosporidium daphniae]
MGDNFARKLEIKIDGIRTSRPLTRPLLRISFGGFYMKDGGLTQLPADCTLCTSSCSPLLLPIDSSFSSQFSSPLVSPLSSPSCKAQFLSQPTSLVQSVDQFPISYLWSSNDNPDSDDGDSISVSSFRSPSLFNYMSSVIFGRNQNAEEVSFTGRSFFFPLSEHGLLFDSVTIGVYEYCIIGGFRLVGTLGLSPPYHAASKGWRELESRSGTTSRILARVSTMIMNGTPVPLPFTIDDNLNDANQNGSPQQRQISPTRLPLWLRPLRTLLDEDTVNLGVRVLLKLLTSFGQGLETYSHSTLLGALIILARFETWKRKNGLCSLTPVCKKMQNCIRDQTAIDSARHAFKFAIASYGWKGLTLLGRRSFQNIITNPSSEKSAILNYLDLKECDLLHITQSNELFQPHCVIFYDVRSCDGPSIVVALRGSLSAADWITSFGGEYIPWNGGFLHSGVAKAAQYVKQEILPMAFSYAQEMNVPKILLTGHSLGGAAALLTLLFHFFDDEDENEDNGILLQACSFGAPPIVSIELLPLFQGLSATSYIFGGDVVPRISYGSLMDYRALIVQATSHVSLKNILNPVSLMPYFRSLVQPSAQVMRTLPLPR